MSGELDILVPPFGRPVHAGDDAHPVDAPEVTVDEGVPGLGLVVGTVGETEVPARILLPRVLFQESFCSAALGWT